MSVCSLGAIFVSALIPTSMYGRPGDPIDRAYDDWDDADGVDAGSTAIGITAPIMVTLGRLLQGFSVGGEFGSSVAFLMEHGSQRLGFAASWQFSVAGLITALASLFGLALNTLRATTSCWKLGLAASISLQACGWAGRDLTVRVWLKRRTSWRPNSPTGCQSANC